jgi:hypothetical protein
MYSSNFIEVKNLCQIALFKLLCRYRNPRLTDVKPPCADHATSFCPQKLAVTSPTNDSCSVGVGRLLTKSHEKCRLLGCDMWFLLRTDVTEERIASIIKMKRISELRTTLAVTKLLLTLLPP